jgi:hypothetical protein
MFADAILPHVPGLEVSAAALALLVAGVVIFLCAVWFGLFVVAPRISRALDRADVEEEEHGDRPD